MRQHDFQTSLRRSNSYVDAPWWLDVYRQAFGEFASAISVRNDGWAQRAGIDRLIVLASARTITIDEKVREKDYGDVLLEVWSDRDRRHPGWVQKELLCDFIAYAIAPRRTCLLLPTLLLQSAWRRYGEEWSRNYKTVLADNGSYVTESVAVPTQVLGDAIKSTMVVRWE